MDAITRSLFHPSSFLFPEMSDVEFAELVRSIKEQGQIEPIVMLGGQVFDGRHRWKACEILGREPKTEEWRGAEDELIRACVARNLMRRHLTPVQKADIALRVATLRKGGKKHRVSGSLTQGEAARMLGVSADSIQRLRKVEEEGSERLVAATLAGELPLAQAAKYSALSKTQQDQILEAAARIRASRLSARRAQTVRNIEDRRADAGAFPTGPFACLIADPPWSYHDNNGAAKISKPTRTSHCDPAYHFDLLSIEQICALPVGDILHKDALVAVWTTSYHLGNCIARVLPAWGLDYVGLSTWVKPGNGVVGAGILRQKSELVVFARKGDGLGKPERQFPSVFEAERGRHSEKPDALHDWFREAYPGIPSEARCELFARRRKDGWGTVWGDDSELSVA